MLVREEGCCKRADISHRRESPPGGAFITPPVGFWGLSSRFILPRRLSSRDFNTPVARPTRSRAKVWAFCNMQAIKAETRLDHGVVTRFGILKQRLLLRRLNETPESETHALLMRQADEAAFLACLTSYPLLTFPCLFEERAADATKQARRQARLYWSGLEFQPPACAA